MNQTVVSLFAGAGGLDLGFKGEGFRLIYACDNDPAAVDCYRRNIDSNVERCDVTSPNFRNTIQSLRNCDVVLGGFPCQGFSKSGPKRADDPRNSLYEAMLFTVRTLRPRLFIAENVDGLSQNFKGTFLNRIIEDFTGSGYRVEHRILDAAAYGVPQHRRRIFFVGINNASSSKFEWPRPTHAPNLRNGEFRIPEGLSLSGGQKPPVTIREAIGDLVQLGTMVDHAIIHAWPKKFDAVMAAIRPGQKLCNVRHSLTSVYTWEIPKAFGQTTRLEKRILEAIARNRRHKQYGDIPNGNPLAPNTIKKLTGITNTTALLKSLLKKGYLKEIDGRYDLKGAMFCSGLFKRPRWDEPSPTILTNFNNPRFFVHPEANRPFSLRECARIQSFPDSFRFTAPKASVTLLDGYRLVGNAVPPILGRVFAKATRQFFTTAHSPILQAVA